MAIGLRPRSIFLKTSRFTLGALLFLAAAALANGAELKDGVVAFRAPAGLVDSLELPRPGTVQVEGWLGERIMVNVTNRLLTVDTEPLLAGFRKKPGVHPWIGEHVGKWLHAATLAWAYTGDARLKEKLDRVAAELIAAQEPDGYLGTYVAEKRFGLYPEADWDVWSHKYNLIGLLTYYQYTGNEAALAACRNMGELLIKTFGPGHKSILSAGTHMGMAATSVLEPMVLLHRFTADSRYLDFAKYIVASWDEPSGPKIIQVLLTEKQVNKTANGKAYEMLSNLVGLCELARATGQSNYLQPVLNAWADIAGKRLYLTGSASQGEYFHGDYELPNGPGSDVAETCVTTTWFQLNLQLLRLTGQAKFANELEKTLYNHLAAAQNPGGADWCYFTPLEGLKQYRSDINCCHSSGPRGMALAPYTAYLIGSAGKADALVVSTFETSRAKFELGGAEVVIEQDSHFPFAGGSTLELRPSRPATFAVKIRQPEWSRALRLSLKGKVLETQSQDGWVVVPARKWKGEQRISIDFELGARLVSGTHGNTGLAALTYGPFVMAYDVAYNPGMPGAGSVQFPDNIITKVSRGGNGLLELECPVRAPGFGEAKPAMFVTFADAGAKKQPFRIWLAVDAK